MAVKEYEVTLRLQLEYEDPTCWNWNRMLGLSVLDNADMISCSLVRKNQQVHPETEEWLPETEEDC